MKVVLLAGGLGTRICEESQYKPKPMLDIGGMPIIWHIMKSYSHFGYNDFIICGGYKQEYIKQWFSNYFLRKSDVTFDFTEGDETVVIHKSNVEPWRVTIVDTGLNTMTGGRIKRVAPYINGQTFMMTYGDAVCDVDIQKLVEFHKANGKHATLTAVKLSESKGVLDIDEANSVKSFREKSRQQDAYINAGFMVLEPDVFKFIEGDKTNFEAEVLPQLAALGELASYKHEGFWQCMDTLREKNILEKLLNEGKAPWVFEKG